MITKASLQKIFPRTWWLIHYNLEAPLKKVFGLCCGGSVLAAVHLGVNGRQSMAVAFVVLFILSGLAVRALSLLEEEAGSFYDSY